MLMKTHCNCHEIAIVKLDIDELNENNIECQGEGWQLRTIEDLPLDEIPSRLGLLLLVYNNQLERHQHK